MRKLTTQEFINRARAVHGDHYGYAFSVYQGNKIKLFIHCFEHGMFEQVPNSHLHGVGCPHCGTEVMVNKRVMSVHDFIDLANNKHNNLYDYSLVKYINSQTKVKIKCKLHGLFEQVPASHLYGRGCPSCSRTKKHTNESFIEKAREIHGYQYGYVFVVYQGNKNKVSIYCHEHGIFEQTPDQHLRGRGCPGCFGTKKHTNESFIEKAREIHGNSYSYPLVEYNGNKNKVSIYCPEHGMFEQSPTSHLSGAGCPGCANYGFDRTKTGYIYVLRSDCGRYMKIGITHNPKQRYNKLKRDTPFSFKRIELIEGPGEQIANLEKELLSCYQPAEFTETFDGYTEWRLWDSNILRQIKQERLNDY